MNNEPISGFLNERITMGEFPSASYLVAEKGEIVYEGAVGLAVTGQESIKAAENTVYDLASLTKPLVTGLICAELIERGQISLGDDLRRFDLGFDGSKSGITIEDLLAHKSGFEAWRPFYLKIDGGSRPERLETLVSSIARAPLSYPTGSKVVYGDPNYILLGHLIEKLYGKDLAKVAETEIFDPLGLVDTFFNPPGSVFERVAACEMGNTYERQTASEMGFDVSHYDWRNTLIRGAVHDENCHFLGGVSGHAGLFSTAREVFEIACEFLPSSTSLLLSGTCGLFRKNLSKGLDQDRSVGFQLASTPDSTAGDLMSPESFGHLGFTGTSLWIDPFAERVFVLLTNRTHRRTLPFADLKSTRTEFHRMADRLLDGHK